MQVEITQAGVRIDDTTLDVGVYKTSDATYVISRHNGERIAMPHTCYNLNSDMHLNHPGREQFAADLLFELFAV